MDFDRKPVLNLAGAAAHAAHHALRADGETLAAAAVPTRLALDVGHARASHAATAASNSAQGHGHGRDSGGRAAHEIDGRAFDMRRIDQRVRLGDVEGGKSPWAAW